ncbi:MAG: single-stranded-DNA-specific exonuclease RecJ [Phycisphaerae bacterium]
MPKNWTIIPAWPECAAAARRLGIHPLLAQVLHNRGVADPEAARLFLNPELKCLLAPETLPGTVEAAAIIARKIRERQPIVIYGDYDVDGITATSILWHLLTLAGARVSFYVPNRLEEGYGVNAEALRQIRQHGADTVITVDCGITAVKEAKVAREIGLTLVITDHHSPGPTLPEADAIVHPTATGSYANPDICGAGVAFKLAWAVARMLSQSERVKPEFRKFLIDATSLAALGTIADVVPLSGENRILARFGLLGVNDTRLIGLRALIESARLSEQKIDSEHVGFWLAPRLNAAGRMGHARMAVELLTLADTPRAKEIAAYLESQNRGRQTVERQILKEACEMINAGNLAGDARRAIVLACEKWHAGVIGIVASRIVDRYCRPTVLISLENGQGQGSARSIRNFKMHQALAECSDHLEAFGGHAMAAGLRIRHEKIEPFTERFVELANQTLTCKDLEPSLRLDAEIRLNDLPDALVYELQKLQPFGVGNPKPKFASGILQLAGEPRPVGKNGQHLQFALTDGRITRKAIAFNQREALRPLLDHRRCRVAFEPILDTYNGRTSVKLQVIDMAFPE